MAQGVRPSLVLQRLKSGVGGEPGEDGAAIMWRVRQDRQEKRARRLQREEEERAAEQSSS